MKKINPKILNAVLCVAMTGLLVTAVIPILGWRGEWLRWAFAASAFLVLAAQVLMPTPAGGVRVRRLARMNVWASALYCLSAMSLFIHNQAMQQSWVAFLLAGAVMQVYATLMLPKAEAQEKR